MRVTTNHADPLVREAAVAALGSIGDARALPAVLSATHDRPAIRRRAVLALAAFDGPEVEAAIAAALTDTDWQVRQAAEDLTLAVEPLTAASEASRRPRRLHPASRSGERSERDRQVRRRCGP